MENTTLKIVLIALLSALFFCSTFIINRYIALDGGHWFWSATLRYAYMLIFLSFAFIFFKGFEYFKSLIIEYFRHFIFWSISGSIGFGIFYSLICYVADNSEAWVLATTWQFTIIASLFILSFFGKTLSFFTWVLIIIIFIGITLINFSHFSFDEIEKQLFSISLIIIASFAYPIGNQLVWEVQNERKSFPKVEKNIINNTFSKVFLLSLGSLPFWIVLYIFFEVGLPSNNQYLSMIFVAFFSGILATSLFLYARGKAKTSSQIALVDATQSAEVIFTLLIEIVFLSILIPNSVGLIGIVFVLLGLVSLSFI